MEVKESAKGLWTQVWGWSSLREVVTCSSLRGSDRGELDFSSCWLEEADFSSKEEIFSL